MIQKKISLLVMALVLLVSGIFININANDSDDKDTVSLTVHKVWENLPEDFEVEGIEVALLRNEEVVDTITLDDFNSWMYTWNGLEAYDEAEELYEYRVEELNVGEDFEVSYQTSTEAKEIEVVITNTYIDPEKPVDPKEPEKPVNPEKPEEPELPNTGISQSIPYLSGLMMIASGLLLVLVTKKRRLENKS